ncbi:MAG: M50 family metallopeptidase [Alcanivorax sp.]
MAADTHTPSPKRNDFLAFIATLGLAFALSYIPVIHWPMQWMETFFHEISHGLASILTGGRIVSIELNINGSGWCRSVTNLRLFTTFSGYFGAVIWGGLIYVMADNASPKSADRIAMLILGLIGMTMLLWARDVVTWGILGIIAVPFIIILKTKELVAEQVFMRFAGIYILLNAIKSPLHLLRSETGGDAATMQSLTLLPQFIWVMIWVILGVGTLILLFVRHIYTEKRAASENEKNAVKTSAHKSLPEQSVLSRTESLLQQIRKMKD